MQVSLIEPMANPATKKGNNTQKLREMTAREISEFVGGPNVKVRVSYSSLVAAVARQAATEAEKKLS